MRYQVFEEIVQLVGIGTGTVVLRKMGVPGDVIKMILKKSLPFTVARINGAPALDDDSVG